MSKQPPVSSSTNGAKPDKEKSYFEQQRELLVRDVAANMEQVLQNINKLNRSLEGIVAVGSEFSSVEALWSHFENVMAKDPNVDAEGEADAENQGQTENDDNEDTEIREQSNAKPGMGKMR